MPLNVSVVRDFGTNTKTFVENILKEGVAKWVPLSERAVNAKNLLEYKFKDLFEELKFYSEIKETDKLDETRFEILKNNLFQTIYQYFEQFLYTSQIVGILSNLNFLDAEMIYSLADLRHKAVHIFLDKESHCVHCCQERNWYK